MAVAANAPKRARRVKPAEFIFCISCVVPYAFCLHAMLRVPCFSLIPTSDVRVMARRLIFTKLGMG